jgi:hypothetical protein
LFVRELCRQCRCCGARSIGAYDEYEICGRCGWEDDPVQYIKPNYAGGANEISLAEARTAWMAIREFRRAALVTTAVAMLDGETELIDGVRKICSLRQYLDPDDPVFMPFRAIDSETDHFPAGDTRMHWAAKDLARIDSERAQYLEQSRSSILDAVSTIIQKYSQ